MSNFSTKRGCGSPVVTVSDHDRRVMSWNPLLLKTRRVGQRCTLNLSKAQTFSRLCGVVVRRGVPAQGRQDTERTKSARRPELEDHVLRAFEEKPETCTRTVSAAGNMSHMTIWRVLGTEGLFNPIMRSGCTP
ncbi:hypothetical protein TNCV_2163061 [Trichonephila clavipes]|nr:hypothetical protein TNCV_2163061 [Trichonephila clavipes]